MDKVFKGSILKVVSAMAVIIGVFFLSNKPAYASTMHYVSNNGWWASDSGSFDASKVTGRVVSGHFQGKDKPEGIATFYDCGNSTTKLIVWNSNGSSFTHVDSFDWTSGSGSFDSNKITGRVVAGDFNGDGYDDIAAFYDYGNGTTRMFVWLSNGSSFTHVDSFDWISGSGSFDANKITGRVVAGDFTGDGRDDVAVFYDCGNTSTKLMVFQSTGSSFTHNSNFDWVTGNSYDANKLTGRVVAGYFQGKDKPEGIAAFYDYGGATSSIHTWLSSGSSFSYASNSGWWKSDAGSFDANKITGRVVAGDFTGTGRDDISVFYDLGSSTTREYMFQSTGSSFSHNDSFDWLTGNSYNANNLTGRVVAGLFQGPNNPAGIAGFYDYGGATTKIHVWLSDAVPTPSGTKGQAIVDYAKQFLNVP
ncbi:FG-GAP repeat domain-containing protein [Clostridium neuense]|uniref:FG-GAP repeat domain-containing protein n=1 Tax=Clostridium neuense TaxID=1728934 RepID=A0ABW8TDW4_9CLOT